MSDELIIRGEVKPKLHNQNRMIVCSSREFKVGNTFKDLISTTEPHVYIDVVFKITREATYEEYLEFCKSQNARDYQPRRNFHYEVEILD